jgi:hypothetical protein
MDTPQRPPCDSVGPPGQPVIAEMGLDMSRFPDPAGAGVLDRAHPDRAAVRAPQEPREEGARQHLRQAGRSGRLHRREHGYVPRRALPPPAPAAAGGRRPAAPRAGPSSDGTEHSPTNAGDACPLRPPGQRHALPDRRPSHQRTRPHHLGGSHRAAGRTHGDARSTQRRASSRNTRPARPVRGRP